VRNLTAGTKVYPHCRPLKAGVVVKVYPATAVSKAESVDVKWLDGSHEHLSELGLKRFDQLLEDTERKFRTHSKTNERLNELINKEGL
jgi:hypothetical protein